jgi:hypothetical protein
VIKEDPMSHSSDAGWNELRRDLAARVAAYAPEWTNPAESDPGITLLELFEFLAESLLDRADLIPEARTRLRDVLDRLDRASESGCDDGTLTRNRYFTGKLLTPEDFDQEQSYVRTKHRRHNRLLHGVGIVRGLEVALEPRAPGDDPAVVVSPGVAIAPDGEELVLCERVIRDLCPGGSACHVTFALVERPVDPTPDGESSRIEEFAEVGVSPDVPRGHLAIARLIDDGGVWRSDPSFRVPRV